MILESRLHTSLQAVSAMIRRNIITEKVKLLLTLYRPLPSPFFYLVKPKLLALPPKVSKNCTLRGPLVTTARIIKLARFNPI